MQRLVDLERGRCSAGEVSLGAMGWHELAVESNVMGAAAAPGNTS